MKRAIELAVEAKQHGERPFGCVIVDPFGNVLGTGSGSESESDPTRHSEIHAIQEACWTSQGLLEACTLFSTHEPCLMCIGAICHSKLSRVVYGSARSDLPLLFRQRTHGIEQLACDTSRPITLERLMENECVALFDDEYAVAVADQMRLAS